MRNIDNEAEAFEVIAESEKGFEEFVHYNTFFQIKYSIPVTEFKGLDSPFWVQVRKIASEDENFIITVYVMKELIDKEFTLSSVKKYGFLKLL